ncbi:MAG: MMPL family transporter [Bacteriovoracaceae bacterium]|nr:MMPL family transporter [Bacteriovoracaceae bacterium]
MFGKIYNTHFRFKYFFFVLALVISILGFKSGGQLPINLNLSDLLPKNKKIVNDMNYVLEKVGGVGYLIVLVGPTHKPEQYLSQLSDALKGVPDVKYTFYEKEEYLLRDKSLYLLTKKDFKKMTRHARVLFGKSTDNFDLGLAEDPEIEQKKEDALDFFKNFKKDSSPQRYYLSHDKKYAMLLIKPAFDSVAVQRSIDLTHVVQKRLDNVLGQKIPYDIIGRYIEKVHDKKQLEFDIARTGIISIVALFIIMVIGIGSIRAALLVNCAMVLSMGWTIGIAQHFVGQINVLTAFLLAILSGLGAEYGIHLIRRFYQERQKGLSHQNALKFTYLTMGRILLSAMLTSSAAFLVLYYSDFRGFSELGVIAGLGIVSIFFVYFLTFPVVGKYLRPQVRFPKAVEIFGFYPFSSKLIWLAPIVIALMIVGLYRAEFEYDFERMHQLSKKVEQMNRLAHELYGKSLTPAALWVKNEKSALKLANWLREDQRKNAIKEVISIHSVLPTDMKSRFRRLKKLKKLVKDITDQELIDKVGIKKSKIMSWLDAKPYTLNDLPTRLQHSFGEGGNIVLAYPRHKQTTAQAIWQFADVLNDGMKHFMDLRIGSDTLVFVAIINYIINDGRVVMALFLIGAFIVFWIDFKTFSGALILEMQLILGIAVLVTLMGLVGERFTILNVAMIPAVLAAGVDMGVHVRHRELEVTGTSISSVKFIAQAIQLSALTTMIGFGSLFFAHAGMLKGIAWISVLGQLSMYLVCMIIFPIIKDSTAGLLTKLKKYS